VLEALYKEGDGVGADLADCVGSAHTEFGFVGVKVPEPSAERSSLPGGLATRKDEDSSGRYGECDHCDRD